MISHYRNWFVFVVLLVIAWVIAISESAYAQFAPPQTITVRMYVLDPDSGTRTSTLCDANNSESASSYGCTAYCGAVCGTGIDIRNYPFTSSTITVDMEGTAVNNRYLRDVVAQEMSPSTHLATAVQAQAIAARTYAYWHIRTDAQTPGSINNSNEYQVFIPYRYDRFSASERAIIDTALQNRYYMSNSDAYTVNIYGQNVNLTVDDPIFSEFFADIPGQTVANTPYPYLLSVADPVSSHPDVPTNGHGHGLSQNGAGRWARGSSSYRCDPAPAPCPGPTPTIPHYRWSVTWTDVKQILTHYYTNIHLRDANTNNAILTPASRWVPLRVRWYTQTGNPPGEMCAGSAIPLEVWVQNTGTNTWGNGGSIALGYRELPGLQVQASSPNGSAYPTTPVTPGGTYTATLLYQAPSQLLTEPHIVAPHFDMFQGAIPFSELEAGKPWSDYFVQITIRSCNKRVYMPLVQSSVPLTGQ